MKKLSYWIKERFNPQLGNPYYTAYGQLTKKQAKEKTKTLFGSNAMFEYKTIEEYEKAIKQFVKDGFSLKRLDKA